MDVEKQTLRLNIVKTCLAAIAKNFWGGNLSKLKLIKSFHHFSVYFSSSSNPRKVIQFIPKSCLFNHCFWICCISRWSNNRSLYHSMMFSKQINLEGLFKIIRLIWLKIFLLKTPPYRVYKRLFIFHGEMSRVKIR